MWVVVVFRIIFWLGIIIAVVSLFFPENLFLLLLGIGLLFIIYGLFEQHLNKKELGIGRKSTLVPVHELYEKKKGFLDFFKKLIPRKKEEEMIAKPIKAISKKMQIPSKEPVEEKEIKEKRLPAWLKFNWLKKIFKRRQKYKEPRINIPNFDKIRKLFQEQVEISKKFPEKEKKVPKIPEDVPKPPRPLFGWEKEEHYVPTGAEDLSPVGKGRYEISQITDERFIPPPKEKVQEITEKKPVEEKEEFAPMGKDGQPDIETLKNYIKKSLSMNYPYIAVKDAVLKAGWPKDTVNKVFDELEKKSKGKKRKKKILILLGMIAFLIIMLIVITATTDLFLIPYWIENASIQFYVAAIIVFLIIIIVFMIKIKGVLKRKQIQQKMKEDKTVQEIKTLTFKKSTYQTDFDRLYNLLKEKKKLTIDEVAGGFGVSKKCAEEWGKILKEEGLITLHYPAIGDPELIWKK